MLKKVITLVFCVVSIGAMAQSNLKIAFVNSQEVIMNMPQYKDMQAQLETMSKQFEDEMLKFKQEGEKKVAEFKELQSKGTDETILKSRAEEIQTLEQRIALFQQTAQEQLQKKQETLMLPIIDAAKKAIGEVGSENGCTYVLDSNVVLYYAPNSEDLTSLVKKKLSSATSAKAAEKTPAKSTKK